MNNTIRILSVFTFSLLSASLQSFASPSTVKVVTETLKTYAFSDPDPVPSISKIYPYCKFDGYTDKGVDVDWQVVVLENDYLKVRVFPQIGGKIWSIYDKTAKRELFYDNDVVKFRDIALRGPWTSGGIEFNYGVIGHAPTCSHPVDWKAVQNPDGSASCFVGVLDLVTRSRWCVEIRLPEDGIYVLTRSCWHNAGPHFQPYYSWFNSAVDAGDDFEMVYPANGAIGHGGEFYEFPTDSLGREVFRYSEQNFGGSKSYHAVGSHKSFFGSYYRNSDCGVLHYSLRDEKLGRKYFSWAQSRAGEIWKDLLTDTRGQYVEMQSGRLFNQNREPSFATPYKQILFAPYSTDKWTEYWFPFNGLGGPADYVTQHAAVSVNDGTVSIYPLHKAAGTLKVLSNDGTSLLECDELFMPGQVRMFLVGQSPEKVSLSGMTLWTADSQEISRPMKTDSAYDPESAEALTVLAIGKEGMKFFDEAEELADRALSLNPLLVDALNLKARLCARKLQWSETMSLCDKVLSIDTYDPEANYESGIAASMLGRRYDAFDRLEVCAISAGPLRAAAYLELATLHHKDGNDDLAVNYIDKALDCGPSNVTALQLLYKLTGDPDLLTRIEEIDPLSHFPEAEKLIAGQLSAKDFDSGIRSEQFGHECLELAHFYMSSGFAHDARKFLASLERKDILTLLTLAYIDNDAGKIPQAEALGIDFIFPFRSESVPVLEWACKNGGGWECRYLLCVLLDSIGRPDASLLGEDDSPSAVYYAYRYTLSHNIEDIRKAHSMDPGQWRYIRDFALALETEGNYTEAARVLKGYFKSHRDNFQIGDAYIRNLVKSEDYVTADREIDRLEYIPFEGQHGSHDIYRDIKLHLAAKAIDAGQWEKAQKYIDASLEWPEHLGVGKPFSPSCQEENWMQKQLDDHRAGKSDEKVYPRLGSLLGNDTKLFN